MHNALITGASRGLGRALALALVARGHRVVGVARHPPALRAVQQQAGPGFVPVAADVSDPDAPVRIAARAADALGAVDLVIHNASTLGPVPLPGLLEVASERVEEVFRTNVFGPLALTRHLAGSMVLRGGGTVVGISSDAAVGAYPSWGPYAASKAAFDVLLRTLAAEHPTLTVLSVDPGEMRTQMHADALPDADPATLRDPANVAEALLEEVSGALSGRRIVLEVA